MAEKKGKYEGSSEGTGLLYEFFTPEEVCRKMWALAYHYGFKGGNVLEPAAGDGRLLVDAPKDAKITAFEINEANFKILKSKFPKADLHDNSFETAFLESPRFNSRIKSKKAPTWLKGYPFDLVIANPPYGKFTGFYYTFFTFKGQFEHFFMEYTMKLVKPGGLGIFIIPSSFLRNGNMYTGIKDKIFSESELVDAYRLPSNIFAKTSIGTDIIVLKKK